MTIKCNAINPKSNNNADTLEINRILNLFMKDINKNIEEEQQRLHQTFVEKLLYDTYLGTLEMFGYGEEANDALKFYMDIKTNGISKSIGQLEGYLQECFEAVNGDLSCCSDKDDIIKLQEIIIYTKAHM